MALSHRKLVFSVVLVAAIGFVGPLVAMGTACPFCSATAQTFSEEISTMDVVVIARLVALPPKKERADEGFGADIPKAKFEIVRVIKGDRLAKPKETIETLYLGEAKVGTAFLVQGIDPPNLMWSTPLPLSDKAQEYLGKIVKLPREGAERYTFFQNYLEDADEMLARDAYDEFAKASYDTVRTLKEQMDHEKIVGWVKDPNIPASRRRLYLVMLGICGSEKDLPLLEKYIKSEDRKDKAGLDALIACYITLKKEAGLPLIEELFLKNKKSDYADTYAAIMALRFHTTDGKVVEKKRLLEAFHYMLDRPDLADLVIPDLARYEDWSSVDKLFDLYKKADEKTSWVRVPVVNYLRVCPLPKAKELLKECEKIDPQAVKRANTFFPATPSTQPANPEKASRLSFPKKLHEKSGGLNDTQPVAFQAPIPQPEEESGMSSAHSASAEPRTLSAQNAAEVASINKGAAPAKALRQNPAAALNLWQLIGVPVGAGLALLFVQWSILRGRVGRR
jgi:hypothetical protein